MRLNFVLEKPESANHGLFRWCKENYMKANPDKHHLLVTTSALTSVINGLQITYSTEEKLLIIKFDSKLSFENHVSSRCIKASENWIVNYMNLSK